MKAQQCLQQQHQKDQLEKQIGEVQLYYKQAKDELTELKRQLKIQRAALKKAKDEKEILQKDRLTDEASLDSLLETILVKYDIKPQAFHGGAMNGVCAKRLLNNAEEIMKKVETFAVERLTKGQHENDKRCSVTDLTEKLQKYTELLLVLDVVIALLRTPAPTDEEILKAQEAILVLEVMWREMELNITPKAHILFCHTIYQFVKYGGIADKVEDFVEKAHQQGKRLDNIVKRMPSQCYIQQSLTKIKRMWMQSDPAVEEQQELVKEISKRKFKKTKKTVKEEAKEKRSKRCSETTSDPFYTSCLMLENNDEDL